MEQENHLKWAEMSLEQNCNQIDGIINNEPPQSARTDTEDRPSIREALRRCQEEAERFGSGNPPDRAEDGPVR